MNRPTPEAPPLGCPDEEAKTQQPVRLFLDNGSDNLRVQERERPVESGFHGVNGFEDGKDFIGGGGITRVVGVGVEVVKVKPWRF